MLASMMKGMPPRCPAQPSPWLLGVRSKLIFFCHCKGPKGENLVGMPALERSVRTLEETSEGNRTLEHFEAP
eukprot:2731792-Alexandrium_andersonii.AAC.1